jgi:hypothetical protein
MTTAATPPTTPAAKRPSLAMPALGLTVAVLLIVVGALLAGRRDERLPAIYGRRRGAESARSVNGTAVLADLFKRAGHRVTTRGRLSPSINDFDIIVWCPDDFEPPTAQQREFLEDWLADASGQERSLIYVGRDFDAAVAYWDRVAPQAPADQADEILRRQAEARAEYEAARSKMPTNQYARWFTVHRDTPPRGDASSRHIQQLTGPWAKGIDAAKAEIRLEGRLAIPTKADTKNASDAVLPTNVEVLLGAGRDPLITRVTDSKWPDGQILVVANGSLVLNYPLVNHEHRKLAVRLISECGAPGRTVFLESGAGGPAVLDKEPAGGPPTALELLKVWPLNAILLHLTILGIVFCLARSLIFGHARELTADSPSDFGKHVTALGRLLARTQDRNYAQARLAQYRQIGQRKSGRSHLKIK